MRRRSGERPAELIEIKRAAQRSGAERGKKCGFVPSLSEVSKNYALPSFLPTRSERASASEQAARDVDRYETESALNAQLARGDFVFGKSKSWIQKGHCFCWDVVD